VVSIEKLFFTEKNKNNAEFVYGVRMLLIDLFWDSAIIKEFSPIELKKNITGNGKADKILVKQTVSKIFHLKQQATLSDAADALGLAYCGYKIEAQQYILNVDRKK
jgi:crossover junction endodeoxyribonuclease RuvC